MSLTPILPSLIMFSITVVIVGLCCLPTLLSSKSSLLNFYWAGFWGFIAMIAVVAGGEQTLMLSGYDAPGPIHQVKMILTLCFVLFVVFAWFRLSGAMLVATVRRIIR